MKDRKEIVLECQGMVTTIAPETDLLLHLFGGDWTTLFSSSKVAATVSVPWQDTTGFFRRIMRRDPPPEGASGLSPNTLFKLGLMFGHETASGPPLPGMRGSKARGKMPPEDGSILVRRATGDLGLHMPETRKSFVSVRVELRDWNLGFKTNVLDGALDGQLVSASEAASPKTDRTLKVTGILRLTLEAPAEQASEELGYPAGATRRWFEGTLRATKME